MLYVGFQDHDFAEDIETREKAGTPPILQGLKAALVLELKHKIGIDTIEEIEAAHTKYFLSALAKIENLELVGDVAADRRVSIVSFNIRHKNRILHPKFVTVLLNDLFGIQSRAGCSCAGPYGHRLLNIDMTRSERYRHWIGKGYVGIKPGWCRVGFHFTMDDAEADYVIAAVNFVAEKGHLFLGLYDFDLHTGSWSHPLPGGVSARASPLPSARLTHTRYSPASSEKYAIHFPSGLHAGSRSALPLVRVRLTGEPFSVGRVQMSPRASTTAHFPVGERFGLRRRPATSLAWARIFGRSPGIMMLTLRVSSVAKSSTHSCDPCWKTISPGPTAGHLTSYSSKRVI